ncbi:hypothetical protein NESM_000392100 [Novymonas esmeraldas]|uniref:Uncharacterized protein n=1 Tax=Novymonas esmeraldas TaxID=1808958 RepID=A0AAW0EM42_9TRYP
MWLRRSHRLLFHIPSFQPATLGRRVTARTPPTQPRSRGDAATNAGAAAGGAHAHASAGGDAAPHLTQRRRPRGHAAPGRALRPGDPLPPPRPVDDADAPGEGYTSQRQAHRQRRRAAAAAVDESVAGSLFTPLPPSSGFYRGGGGGGGGVDEHAMEAPRPSREARQQQLRESLEAHAASTVEFTDGGEGDVQLNGLPAEQYHGQAGWTTIPTDSALYNTLYGVGDLESRQRTNSWAVARRHGDVANGRRGVGDLLGDTGDTMESGATPPSGDRGGGEHDSHEVLDDRRRRRQRDDSLLASSLEGELLEPMQESVGQPRSTYAMRKMFVDGLVGYQGMITRAEEASVSEELLHLLQDGRAAYVAEEARYCVNLYEKELGIPGKDTLAFALARCPTLQRVLYRFFFLGLIPAVPNVCQVSEMVGTFSGYPVHRHPPSIGSYVGLLNLVSTSVLHLQHKDAPWFPRLHLAPRSLFVVTEPCLSDYALGYKQVHQPFHTFEYATRVSKDYRIEVLFATVETAQTKTLAEAVQLTEYAERQAQREPQPALLGTPSPPPPLPPPPALADAAVAPLHGHTDAWLQRLQDTLHASEGERGEGRAKPLDGHALRRQLLAEHRVGDRPREDAAPAPPSSAAQRRLAALKARYTFAQELKASQRPVEVEQSGPRLIRGHAPRDRHLGIK